MNFLVFGETLGKFTIESIQLEFLPEIIFRKMAIFDVDQLKLRIRGLNL